MCLAFPRLYGLGPPRVFHPQVLRASATRPWAAGLPPTGLGNVGFPTQCKTADLAIGLPRAHVSDLPDGATITAVTPPTPERLPTVLMYAALHGVNIPGGLWLTEARVRAALKRLPASMTYRQIVGRPDSILLSVSGTTTEDNVRRAVSEAVGCRCVVISTTSASRIVDKAIATLCTLGPPVTPPYRITIEGIEWEWCLVFSSDRLPSGMPDATWLFERTPTVVAVTPLEGRALLARKRRFTPNGARITPGSRLLDPWQKVLDANGVTVSC